MDSTSRFRRLFARRLVKAMGLTALALPAVYSVSCGGTTVIDPGGAGGSGGNSSNTSTDSATTTNDSVAVTSVSSSTGGGCVESTTTASGGMPTLHYTRCLDNLNQPCPANTAQAEVVMNSLLQSECCTDPNTLECEVLQSVDCGPYNSSMGACCFEITTVVEACAVPGRPYTVDGQPRLADAHERDDWQAGCAACPSGLSDEARQALARFWSRTALAEHASVASFSRFALQLMAVGAPSELIADAHRAALDEVEHARLAFGLASSYADEAVGPGALSLDASDTPVDLATMAAATAAEGCVNETLAALLAVEQLAHSRDPQVRGALELIVADELRHAELAWRTVAWALREGGDEVRAAVSAAFARAAYGEPDASASADADLVAHGYLAREAAQQALAAGMRDVVMPSARALLAA